MGHQALIKRLLFVLICWTTSWIIVGYYIPCIVVIYSTDTFRSWWQTWQRRPMWWKPQTNKTWWRNWRSCRRNSFCVRRLSQSTWRRRGSPSLGSTSCLQRTFLTSCPTETSPSWWQGWARAYIPWNSQDFLWLVILHIDGLKHKSCKSHVTDSQEAAKEEFLKVWSISIVDLSEPIWFEKR